MESPFHKEPSCKITYPFYVLEKTDFFHFSLCEILDPPPPEEWGHHFCKLHTMNDGRTDECQLIVKGHFVFGPSEFKSNRQQNLTCNNSKLKSLKYIMSLLSIDDMNGTLHFDKTDGFKIHYK
jgi:hypothetical protein